MSKSIEEKIKAIKAGRDMAEMQIRMIEDDQERYATEQELLNRLIGQKEAFDITINVLENY